MDTRALTPTEMNTVKHVPDYTARGLQGSALCGRWAHYLTGDHALCRTLADEARRAGETAGYCERCIALLRREYAERVASTDATRYSAIRQHSHSWASTAHQGYACGSANHIEFRCHGCAAVKDVHQGADRCPESRDGAIFDRETRQTVYGPPHGTLTRQMQRRA